MAKYKELQTPIGRVSMLLFKEYADLLLALLFPNQTIQLLDIEENIERLSLNQPKPRYARRVI